jgi:hypothetical protein
LKACWDKDLCPCEQLYDCKKWDYCQVPCYRSNAPSSGLSASSQRLSHSDQHNLDRFNLAKAVKVRLSARWLLLQLLTNQQFKVHICSEIASITRLLADINFS